MTLGVSPKTHEILFNITSDDNFGDAPFFKDFFSCLPGSTKTVITDGAGDTHEMYSLVVEHGLCLITPPRKSSIYRNGLERTKRDQYIKEIREDGELPGGAMNVWKQKNR